MVTFNKLILVVFYFLLFGVAALPQGAKHPASGVVFAPKDSRFAVSFPGTPTVSGSGAELNTSDFTLQVSYGAFRGVSFDDAVLEASEIAKNRKAGVTDPSVTVNHSRLGTEIVSKGDYLGQPFESHFYVDPDTGESVFLYGAATNDTPKQRATIQKFFSSVKLNPKYVSSGYHFAPESNDFEVIFPRKPQLDNLAADDNVSDNGLNAATLLIGSADKGSKLTASGGYSDVTLQAFQTSTEDELKKVLLGAAQQSGVSSPTVSVLKSKFGQEIVTRGYVTVDGIQMLYEKHFHIGSGSMIVLEVHCSAKLFPTTDISSFLSSVKLRK